MNALYAAIVPAGGLSSRMKRLKPLLPLGEATLADHVIATLLSAGVDVFLVTGYRHDEIKAGIKQRDITIVDNPDYEQGMLSSIQAGLRRLPARYRGFLVLPLDVPLVRPETIRQLLYAAVENPVNIIYPVFGGKRGHPPLIPSNMVPSILGWKEEGGLKTFLNSQEELAREVPVADSNILFDVDTPGDYRLLLKRLRQSKAPS